jgi:2-(1,2-epoxy-1,2-dihydrophenyl)acetyl-CoA isomerase
MTPVLETERPSEHVRLLRLNRPDNLNTMTAELCEALHEELRDVASDRSCRAVVITGNGRGFCAGLDLAGFGDAPGNDGSDPARDRLANQQHMSRLILRVRDTPQPVIAAVNGPAVGIGCSLALAADLIVAGESAYFLLAFVNIGLGLDGGASMTLPERVGHARAFEIAYLGQRISADRALEWGLVNQVVPDDSLTDTVTELAAKLAAGPPGSYANIKRTINASAYERFEQLLDQEAVLQQERAESADFMEGVVAFMQKRPPEFTGE